VGDLIGSGYEPYTSRTRSERLTTCVICPAVIYLTFYLGLKQSCSAIGSLTAVADEVDNDTQITVADNLHDRTHRLAA